MFTIAKRFTFEASHQLLTLPPTHPCARLHGHSYTVELLLASKNLDDHGFVRDYGDLRVFRDWLGESMDHRHLNDLLQHPTAENLAFYCYVRASAMFSPLVIGTRLYETATTWAEYRPDAD